jgi:Flp pilus assembly protein TadD
VYFELKQFGEAVSDCDKVLALDPEDSAAYNDRGMAKIQLGDTYQWFLFVHLETFPY